MREAARTTNLLLAKRRPLRHACQLVVVRAIEIKVAFGQSAAEGWWDKREESGRRERVESATLEQRVGSAERPRGPVLLL